MKFLPIVFFLPLLCGIANAGDWYVDGVNGINGPSGGTQGPTPVCDAKKNTRGGIDQPFKDFWCAQHHALPGDTIHLLPTMTYPSLYISVSGAPGAPITITGDGIAPNLTKVTNGPSTNSQGYAIDVATEHYVNVANFDVTHAYPTGNLGASGILISGSDHVGIMGNVIHDTGGNGISSLQSDYVTIAGNVVTNNGWDSSTGLFNSGISVLRSANSDANTTDYKIVVAGNLVYGNHNTPRQPGDPCGPNSQRCSLYYSDSDGNGIILDRNDGSGSPQITYPFYNGQALITNNVVFGNGGRGIHIFLTNHVTVTNNTCFLNNQDPYESTTHSGEIEADRAGDVHIYNNIAYTDGQTSAIYGLTHNNGHHVAISVLSGTPDMGDVWVDYNLTYSLDGNTTYANFHGWNTNAVYFYSHNLWGDPLFVNPSNDASVADFRLQSGSPALAAASSNQAPSTDILGNRRPWGRTDLGAYQLTQ